jgi:plastocyanin
MWSRNSAIALALSAALVASAARADQPAPPTEPKTVTPAMEKNCAQATKRYAELFPDAKPKPGEVVVLMYKYTFCPANVTVKPGTTVRWVNMDKRTSHSVWLKQSGEKESPRMFGEEDWSFTFTTPGKYPYLCGPHWNQEGMYGHVTVSE